MTIPVFPVLIGQTWPVTRAPVWKTISQEAMSGKETRLPQFTFPRYKWSLPWDTTFSEFAELLGFINSLAGGALPFYFTDAHDNAVAAQGFGEGDGTTTAFQLVRAFGGFVEPVQSVNGAPSIYVAGTLKTVTTDYTIGSTGIVTFVAAPAAAAALTWTGSYYWLCRLDDDTAEFSEFAQGFLELKKLAFTSIKL